MGTASSGQYLPLLVDQRMDLRIVVVVEVAVDTSALGGHSIQALDGTEADRTISLMSKEILPLMSSWESSLLHSLLILLSTVTAM